MNRIKNITLLDKIRHLLNPLHIYCRLTYFGISGKCAMGICRIYEENIYKPTLGRQGLATIANGHAPFDEQIKPF